MGSSWRDRPGKPQKPDRAAKPPANPPSPPSPGSSPSPPSSPETPARAGWRKPTQGGASPRSQWQQGNRKSLFTGAQVKVTLFAFLSVALLFYFVYSQIVIPVKAPLLAFVATSYSEPFPPNALAREDLDRLKELFAGNEQNIALEVPSTLGGNRQSFLEDFGRAIAAARPGGPEEDCVLIYLSAHGAVGENDQPCLILPESKPLDSRTWLPMVDLLTKLETIPGDQTKVLLLLDGSKLADCWQAGILYNGFADSLTRLMDQQGSRWSRVAIINSTQAGRQAELLPEAGGSLFGLFSAAAFEGYADDGDDRLTLQELLRYLQERVLAVSKDRRGTMQIPQLIPAQPVDFPLNHPVAHAESGRMRPIPAVALVGLASDTSLELWKRYDELRQRRVYHRDPLRWSMLRQSLLRLDELRTAGSEYSGTLANTIANAERLMNELDTATTRKLPAASLAIWQKQHGRSPEMIKTRDAALENAKRQLEAREAKEAEMAAAAAATPQAPETKADPNGGAPSTSAASANSPSVNASSNGAGLATSPNLPAAPPDDLPPLPPYESLANVLWQRWQQSPWDDRAVEKDLARIGHTDEAVFREIQFLRIIHDGLLGIDNATIAQSVRQNAIALQQLAEEAGAPPEARCYYWTAEDVQLADQKLRAAFDKFLVGDTTSWNDAEEAWHALSGSPDQGYPQLIARQNLVARAFELRDQLYSDLPQYTRWALHSPENPDVQAIGRLLNQLTEATRRLSDLLLDPRFDSENWNELQTLVDGSTSQFAELQGYYQQECNRREKDIVSRDALSKVRTVIDVAIIPGKFETTANLRKRFWTHAFEAIETDPLWQPGPSAPPSPVDDNPALQAAATIGLPLLERWLSANELPGGASEPAISAASDANPATSSSPPSDVALSQSAERARQSLASFQTFLDERTQETLRQLSSESSQGLPAPELARQSLTRADRRLRQWAEFLFTPPWNRESDNPSPLLEDVDEFFFTLWQADRALGDFWGSPPPASSPFFVTLVEQQLGVARTTFRNAKPYLRVLETRLARNMEVLNQWNPLETDDIEATSDETAFRHKINVQPANDMPSALACVRVTDLSGNTIPLVDQANRSVDRRGVEIQTGRELTHQILNAKLIAANARTLDAVIAFRGHRRPVQFHVDTDHDSAIAQWQAPEFVRPQITVRGSKLERAQVLFVLDCSSSMQYLHDWQQGDGTPLSRMNRMEIATTVLSNVLNSLSAEQYDVGLMLYGHRLGWDRDKTSGAFRPVYKKGSQAIIPGEDAELVHRIRRFDEESRNSLLAALEDLAPYGETPLYFSIKKATEQFRPGPQPKIIVVITDGADNIFQEPPGGSVKIKDLLAIPELNERAPADRRIQLNILGLIAEPATNSPREHLTAWAQDKKRWFTDGEGARVHALVKQTGGQFFEVSQFSQLEEMLESTLQQKRFFVTAAGKPDPVDDDWVPLDQSWRLPDSSAPGDFQVQLAGLPSSRSTVTLENGDWIDLDYNPKSGKLEHRRFDGKPQEAKLIVDGYYIGGHLPERTGTRNVTYRVSTQNADARQFSPRPAAVWAEIRPDRSVSDASGSGTPPVFYAYDLDFEPKRPVPVLQFKIQNWPATEKRAILNVWISPDPIERQATAIDIDPRKPSHHEARGATFDVEPVPSNDPQGDDTLTLQIEEVHSQPGEPPCFLQFLPTPAAMEHRFQNGRAKHVVTYRLDALKRRDITMLVIDKKQIVEKWIPSSELAESLPNR